MTSVLFVVPLVIAALNHAGPVRAASSDSGPYTNEWAVEIKGGVEEARAIAKRYGYGVVEQMPYFDDLYILTHPEVPHRSKRSSHEHTKRLTDDSAVIWAEQQYAKSRVKRATAYRTRSDGSADFNDPSFTEEWYLDEKTVSQVHKSMGVSGAWAQGYSGKGVVLSVLDDGLESNHSDIYDNYDPYASYDLNDKDNDPFPRYDPTDENKHGTRCAGEIAMMANNGVCGVGIAFNSKIGGVRMLDGPVTDRLEAQAINFNMSYVDIYSASWGPNDDGVTVEGPGTMAGMALEKGATQGRNGKGSLLVWASGNGGRMQDNCNCDGYTSSIYTLSVSSATQHGHVPWYAERCSSTIATTYSSGNGGDLQVVSSDIRNRCTTSHTGTSAAAPMAAAIYALLLEANPDLTWRDVQHLTALTSRVEPLSGDKDWYKNAAGFCVNQGFGFGLLDANGLIKAGDRKSWVTVPPQEKCEISSSSRSNLPQNLSSGHYAEVIVETDGCHGQPNEINYLEHVQFIFNLNYSKRGAIMAELISPSGTKTILMHSRDWDKSTDGFKNWPLMSVHTWGENPNGTWIFRVYDNNTKENNHGVLTDLKVVLYGTKTAPEYRNKGPINQCDLPFPSEASSSAGHSLTQAAEAQMSDMGSGGGEDFWAALVKEALKPKSEGLGMRDDNPYQFI